MSEYIDFSSKISDKETLLNLSGTLKTEQIAMVHSRLFSLINEKSGVYFLVLENARFKDTAYLTLFLELLSKLKSKGIKFIIIFDNDENRSFFKPFYNIFEIYTSLEAYRKDFNILKKLKQTGVIYQRSTGIRLAPGIAIVLLLIIAGWILTLFYMLDKQGKEVLLREKKVTELENLYRRSETEIENLKASIGPFMSLGIKIDTSQKRPLGSINNWEDFLDKIESERKSAPNDSISE